MTIKDCPNCGGTHYGAHRCPFIKAPCAVCGADTIFACSDCGIDSGGKESVHICEKPECRDGHERDIHGRQGGVGNGLGIPTTQPEGAGK